MLDHEFREQIDRLVNTFGKNAFTTERVGSIWSFVKDLNVPQFRKISDHFINEFRHAPLPQDFLKAVYEEKKRTFYSPNNSTVRDADIHEVDCEHCFETGLVFTKDETLPQPILMRCSCRYGANSLESDIPQWNNQIGQVFRRQPFPSKHFIPQVKVGRPLVTQSDGKIEFQESMMAIMERWSAKKKFSAEFWAHQIKASQGGI